MDGEVTSGFEGHAGGGKQSAISNTRRFAANGRRASLGRPRRGDLCILCYAIWRATLKRWGLKLENTIANPFTARPYPESDIDNIPYLLTFTSDTCPPTESMVSVTMCKLFITKYACVWLFLEHPAPKVGV